jgi:hypothetical protein
MSPEGPDALDNILSMLGFVMKHMRRQLPTEVWNCCRVQCFLGFSVDLDPSVFFLYCLTCHNRSLCAPGRLAEIEGICAAADSWRGRTSDAFINENTDRLDASSR